MCPEDTEIGKGMGTRGEEARWPHGYPGEFNADGGNPTLMGHLAHMQTWPYQGANWNSSAD